MSKIVKFYELGGPEVLNLEEAPLQQPGPGEVRLQVKASGLNRAEALFTRGYYLEQPKLPARIGYEAAGIVDAVGEGVDRSWMGKHVATMPGFSMNQYGVLGEQAVVPVRVLGEYPENLSPTQAASIWMQYLTAYGALIWMGHVKAGDFVLISAASSSVGLAAIQIVKAEGGVAIAATRTSIKKDELLALGADHVIVTEEEDLVARVREISGGNGARLIFDPVAGPFVEKLAAAACPGGTIFNYGNLSMQPTPYPAALAIGKGLNLQGYTLRLLHDKPQVLAEARRYVYDRLQNGRFVPKIARIFPLSQIQDAFRYLESNVQVGKVVVTA
jgi:NADPH:quinone reductase-like Zn-dependent oxidoreductase